MQRQNFLYKMWSLKLYLILFVIVSVIANAVCMKIEEKQFFNLPATYNQTKELAESVCTMLFFETKFIDDCEASFLSYSRNTQAAPVNFRVACHSSSSATEQTITFVVKPMDQWQLIAFINTANREDELINYILVERNTNYTSISLPMGQYTTWTTVLDDFGTPMPWRRGRDIQSWDEIQKNLENRTYEIKYEFLTKRYLKGSHFIDAMFTWNSTGGLDSCFDVYNSCNKKTQGDIYEMNIKSYEERVVIIRNLTLDDVCTFYVKGLYGTTKLPFRTPSCYDLPTCVPKLQAVQNIELHATQLAGKCWAVLVSWARPVHAPHQYNVTLATQNVHNKIVPGNSTEVLFTKVCGEGRYEVSVGAQAHGKIAYNSRSKLFPAPVIIQKVEGIPMGLTWMLALLSATVFTISLMCWRRRLHYKRTNIYFSNELGKMTEETDTDGESPESGSEDQWEIRLDRLVLHEIIGEGAFGVVRRGTLVPNKDVAVKMLKDYPSVEEIRSFRSEMELMKSVGVHPHVVSLVGCYSGRRPLILAEYCSRGDLLTFLRCSWDVMTSRRNAKYYNNNDNEIDYRPDQSRSKSRDSKIAVNRLYDLQGVCDTELTLLDLLSFCRQIAMGMEFLESNRVVHRDLAARNILVTADRTMKIADFGLSRDVYQENQYKQKGNGKMPVKWMALESLTHRIYTTQSDVWSFGVVMWEVVTVGGAPYAAVSAARLPRLLAAGYRMPRPQNCSPALYELMLSCWNARPRSRPTFSMLHAALDDLLCARADHYLTLAVPDAPPDAPLDSPCTPQRNFVRTLARSTLLWGSNKSYERPQAITRCNYYTMQPALSASRDVTADMKIP